MAWYGLVLIIVQVLGMIWGFRMTVIFIRENGETHNERWYDKVRGQQDFLLKMGYGLMYTYMLASVLLFGSFFWWLTLLGYIFGAAGKHRRKMKRLERENSVVPQA